MGALMPHHGRMANRENDWFQPGKRQELIIVAGLDVSPFEEAIRGDILNTVILSAVLIVMGFGGLVSLSWMQNYRVAQKNLQDTTAYADEIVTHLPVGLIATDTSGRIAFFNAAAERITGLDLASLRGQNADESLPGNFCGLQEALAQGETILEEEMTCRTPGGAEVPVSVSAVRIVNAMGDYVGQVLIIGDLGEVGSLQDEVRRQEKLAAIGGLAAGVAHEIRNPLSSIKALATFFAGQFASGSEGREAADVMTQEVDRLNRAITEQADAMAHVMFGGLTHAPAVALAEKLIELAPAGLDRVFFADAGSVAVEVAMKMAIQYWSSIGRPAKRRFVSLRNGYHGDTLGGMSVCDPVTGMHHLFSGVLPKQLFAPAPVCGFDEPCRHRETGPQTRRCCPCLFAQARL